MDLGMSGIYVSTSIPLESLGEGLIVLDVARRSLGHAQSGECESSSDDGGNEVHFALSRSYEWMVEE